jgi:hypothetical protein
VDRFYYPSFFLFTNLDRCEYMKKIEKDDEESNNQVQTSKVFHNLHRELAFQTFLMNRSYLQARSLNSGIEFDDE